MGTVAIRVAFTDPRGVSLDSLLLSPEDIDGLLDSLGAASPHPRPDFETLEAELETYQRQHTEAVEELRAEWEAHRGPVAALADTLRGLDRTEPAYGELYERFRATYGESIRREAEFERDLRSLTSVDEDLARRAAVAADSLRRWEASAYRDLDSILAARAATTGRHAVRIGLDSLDGLSLLLGPWWAIGRSRHPTNPFLEYYWSVPFVVGRLVPLVVPITWHNGTIRWRH